MTTAGCSLKIVALGNDNFERRFPCLFLHQQALDLVGDQCVSEPGFNCERASRAEPGVEMTLRQMARKVCNARLCRACLTASPT